MFCSAFRVGKFAKPCLKFHCVVGLVSAPLAAQPVWRGARVIDGTVHRAEDQQGPSAGRVPVSIRQMTRPKRRVVLRELIASEFRPVNRKPGLTAVGVNRELQADVRAQGEWSSTSEGGRV